MFTPEGLITIFALIFVGMCFALVSGWLWVGGGLAVVAILIAMFGMYLLTDVDS